MMHSKKSFIVVFVLCLLGVLLSSILTYIHVMVHMDPSYSALCAVGKQLNCETVAASTYSVFMGIPVSIFGVVFYLVLGLAALNALVERRAVIPGVTLALALLGALVSIGLFALSSLAIQSFCLLCMGTYLINIALFLLNLKIAKSEGRVWEGFVADMRRLVRSRWAWIQTGALLLLFLVAGPFGGFPRYWEIASWQSGAPFSHGVDDDGQPWLGAKNPEVVVTEYLDYDCPACRASHKKLRRMLSRHSDVLRIVRHDMPRTSCVDISGDFDNRCAGARAAFCAKKQGRFWDLNDALLMKPKPTGSGKADFEIDLAVALGFDREAFSLCMKHPDTVAHVQQLFETGRRAGVRLTPSYQVGDELLVGFDKLVSHIDL